MTASRTTGGTRLFGADVSDALAPVVAELAGT
jgi:hypothetical protein